MVLLGNGLPERGVPALPGLLGAPILVDLVTAIAIIAFAVYCRGLSDKQRTPRERLI